MIEYTEDEFNQVVAQKDNAYWERNQLVAALSKLWPAHLAKHPKEDESWDDDWRTIVVIYIEAQDAGGSYQRNNSPGRSIVMLHNRPFYQLTWHLHDTDVELFDHLTYETILSDEQMNLRGQVSNNNWSNSEPFVWDGHSTEEKYRRLRSLVDGAVVTYPNIISNAIQKAIASGKELGQKFLRRIVAQELDGLSLATYEIDGVFDAALQERRGYPKGANSRKVVEELVVAAVKYHRDQIQNTGAEEDGMARDTMAANGDSRVRMF